MTRIMESAEIGTTPAKIARYLWDPNNLPNYFPVTRVQVLETSPRRVKARHDFTAAGKTMELVCVIEAVDRDRKIRVTTEEGMTLDGTWALQDLKDRTRTSYILDYEPPGGVFGKILDTFKMKKEMRRIAREALGKLKGTFEAERA